MRYEVLESAIRAWCQAKADIRAAVVVGSRAVPGRWDVWSDLDLVIFVDEPAAWLDDAKWVAQLGPVWLTHRDWTAAGDVEWYALFDGGLKVDIVITRAAKGKLLADLLAAAPYGGVFRRGVRVLYAADEIGTEVPPQIPHPTLAGAGPPPPELEFHGQVSGMLMAVSKAARLLGRGEVWRAQQLIDCGLKTRLLTMMVWRATATAQGPGPDTGYDGRGLEQWADEPTLAALPGTFGGYDASALRAALGGTLALYSRLARETAAAWGLDYPEAADAKLRAWLAESGSIALNGLPG